MKPRIAIRVERPDDAATIAQVVQSAYAAVAYSDRREHLMIERLRKTGAYIPSLSLLAEVDGEAAGHILLTRAHIRTDRSAVETLALAPLSVVPTFQGQGVGKRLVTVAHERAAGLGFGSIVLVGIPGYYPQFGYEPLHRYPITLPFDAPDDNCMILSLVPGALDGVSGILDYGVGWQEH